MIIVTINNLRFKFITIKFSGVIRTDIKDVQLVTYYIFQRIGVVTFNVFPREIKSVIYYLISN